MKPTPLCCPAGEPVCLETICACVCHRLNRATPAGRAFRAWESMKQRCLNKRATGYKHYGGRGIVICQEWVNDFHAFYAYLGPPGAGLTLDRFPNNDGNYEPGNVRWASRVEQAVNRRSTRTLENGGLVQCIEYWGRELGLTGHSVSRRLGRGWSEEDALTTPPQHRLVGALLAVGDEAHTLSEWARKIGISPQALGVRLKRMSLEEAVALPPGPSSCPRPSRRKRDEESGLVE